VPGRRGRKVGAAAVASGRFTDYVSVVIRSLPVLNHAIEPLVCWKCGASLESDSLPLARLAECPACHADLHVCRLCEFYDPGVANSCREPIADVVKDKERANFCGYFQPRPDACAGPVADPAREAKARLDALFGDTRESGPEGIASDAERARRRLEGLFDPDEG
jgi:ribosomal protein L40E